MQNERVNARASAARARNKVLCGFVTLFIAGVFGASVAFADGEKTTFNIEAQLAKTSLTLYARQAQVQLGFAADTVDDILTNSVKGEYDKVEALELLLEGTGLQAEHGANGIIVRAVQKREVAGDVDTSIPADTSTTGLQLNEMEAQAVPPPRSSAASGSRKGNEIAENHLQEVVVTGSRIRGAQAASPVITISRQDIERAGFSTVEELVDKLPQNFGAGTTQDTITDRNRENQVGGVVSNIGRGTSVNLRGLGASSTLVLLNGRRLSPSGGRAAFTDISDIPVTAIERVEVLTDGASAVYGSDAIAGVVNFVLRDDYEGAETRLRYGTDTGGDTSAALFGQSFGKSWDSGNALLSYEYFRHERLAKKDRQISSSADLTRFGGSDWRPTGGNPANVEAGGVVFAIPTAQDGTSLTADDFDPAAPLNRNDSGQYGTLLPEQERHSGFFNLSQKLGSSEVFAQARYSTRRYQTSGSDSTISFDVPDTNPFFVDPTGTGLTSVRVVDYDLFEDLGPTYGTGGADAYGGALGLAFPIGDDWSGELAGNWSKEESKQTLEQRLIDTTALLDAVNEVDPNLAFNPFGDGAHTNPAVLDAIRDSRTSRELDYVENELWEVSLSLDGKILDLPSGAVKAATGIEHRQESLLSLGDREAQQLPRRDLSRKVTAVYAEVIIPVVGSSNERPGIKRLEISLAGRYEDYSDFGSSTNPKVGLVWRPTSTVAFRTTYGTSFKAPSLVNMDVTNAAENPTAYFPQLFVDLGLIPFTALILTGSNEDLKAEEATTWTAGIQWTSKEVLDGLSIDMTYFNIDFSDRIDVPVSNLFSALSDPRVESLLITDPTPEQIEAVVDDPRYDPDAVGITTSAEDLLSGVAPVDGIFNGRRNNLARSVVTGVELQLSYAFDTTLGSFDVGFNGNYLLDFEQALLAADPLVDEVDTLGRPVDFRARGNLSWSREGWSVTAFGNYTDSYTDNISNPSRPVDSQMTMDLSVSYATGETGSFARDTRLSLIAQNLFDKAPPFANTLGGRGYDSANHNPLGRFLSFQITKEW